MIRRIMSAYLTKQIAVRRKRLETLETERVTIIAELRAYEDALAKSPGAPIGPEGLRKSEPESLRVFGAWSTILQRLAEFKRFNARDVMLEARILYNEGKLQKPQTNDGVRAQLSIYAKKGIVKRVGGGHYCLTNNARAAFPLIEQRSP